jgi:hypothetical protein
MIHDPAIRNVTNRVVDHLNKLLRNTSTDTQIDPDEFANGVVVGDTRTPGCIVVLDRTIADYRHVVLHNNDDDGGPNIITAMIDYHNEAAFITHTFDGDTMMIPVIGPARAHREPRDPLGDWHGSNV